MAYDYEGARKRVIDILSSKTEIQKVKSIPSSEGQFTYDNGITSWVGAIFVDIEKSTALFKDTKHEILARMMRAFTSEIISILSDDDNYRQIGIRGDCVYGIFSVPNKENLRDIISHACMINAFLKMLNKVLKSYSFPTINAGIGLGCSEDLIIKAGKSGTGISDLIWIGSAVIDASNLSSVAGRNGRDPIMMDYCFYNNIKDFDANKDHKFSYYIHQASMVNGLETYSCNMVNTNFDRWIEENMQ